MRYLVTLILFLSTLYGNEAEAIIRKLDENLRGQNVYMKMRMSVTTRLHERTVALESWSQGSKKSFVRITYPPMERGITFLSLEGQMWQYVPKIERIIKIPPSMMLQNWMGSDITNDDMVRQSSLIDDYHATLLSKEGNIATIELIPKPDAAVVWGKIVTRIDTTHYTGIEDRFYDETGLLIRTFHYEDVKQFGRYYLPTLWRVQPAEHPENHTTITLETVIYDQPISDAYFTKSALRRFSK